MWWVGPILGAVAAATMYKGLFLAIDLTEGYEESEKEKEAEGMDKMIVKS